DRVAAAHPLQAQGRVVVRGYREVEIENAPDGRTGSQTRQRAYGVGAHWQRLTQLAADERELLRHVEPASTRVRVGQCDADAQPDLVTAGRARHHLVGHREARTGGHVPHLDPAGRE